MKPILTNMRAPEELLEVPAPLPGHYTSTACMHGLHAQCRRTCKFCSENCRCDCHTAADDAKATLTGRFPVGASGASMTINGFCVEIEAKLGEGPKQLALRLCNAWVDAHGSQADRIPER